MASDNLNGPVELTEETRRDLRVPSELDLFDIGRSINFIWERIGHDDALIAIKKPFLGVKSEDAGIREEAILIIKKLVRELGVIATDLEPFMPQTSAVIKKLVKENKMPAEPLFLRK